MDIVAEVAVWDGVTQRPHRSGGTELVYRGRVLGHVRDDGAVDLRFHPRVRDMLVETGRAEPHRAPPAPGWVTLRVGAPEDAAEAVELFRLAYERARVTGRTA